MYCAAVSQCPSSSYCKKSLVKTGTKQAKTTRTAQPLDESFDAPLKLSGVRDVAKGKCIVGDTEASVKIPVPYIEVVLGCVRDTLPHAPSPGGAL